MTSRFCARCLHGSLLAFLAVLSVCLPGLALSEGDPARSVAFYSDAQSRLEAGDVGAAVIQLKNAVVEDPGNLEARLLLAQLYLRTGQGQAAEWEVRAALRRGVPVARTLLLLGQAYSLQGRHEQILAEIRSENAPSEQRSDVLLIRAGAALNLGRLEETAELLEELTALHPDDVRGHLGVARLRIAQGKTDEAEEHVDAALRQVPDLPEGLIMKGDLRRSTGDAAGALRYYRQMAEMVPGSILALERLALARLMLGQFKEAQDDVRSIEAVSPGHPIIPYLTAAAFAKMGEFARALETLQAAEDVLKDYAPAAYLLGVLGYAEGDQVVAEKHLTAYLAADPANAAVRKLLASAQLRSNQPEKALSTLGPTIERGSQDPQILALAAMAHLSGGRLNEATSYFEQAAALAPDDPRVLMQLALNLISSGDAEKAITPVEAILGMQPEELGPRILLVLASIAAGRFDEAGRASEDMRTLWPGNAVAPYLAALAYAGRGDGAAAREMFLDALAIDPGYLQAHLGLAELDLRDGLTGRAASRYDEILADDGRNARAMIGLANVAIAEGDTKAAVGWLEKARLLDMRDLNSRLALVAIHLGDGRPEKALVVGHELSRLAPRDARVLDALARARLAMGEYESAIASFEQLLQVVPRSAEANYRLGFAQVMAGRLADARKTLVAAAALDSQSEPIHRLLAEVELRAGNVAQAFQLAESFRDRRPDLVQAQVLFAEVALKTGHLEAAIDGFEAAWGLQPSSALAVGLAHAKARAGMPESAVRLLEGWLGRHSDDRLARRALGEVLIRTGQPDGAIAQFESLLADDPGDWVILNNLAWLYYERGDHRALSMARRAHQVEPDQPAILDTLGWILVNNDNVAEGVELLREAIARRPDEPEIHYHFAYGLYRAGLAGEAAAQLKKLLDAHPDFESAGAAKALFAELSKGS